MLEILREKLLSSYAEVDGPLETKCWMFLGTWVGRGYGIICEPKNNKVRHYAHRLSWQIHHGSIPEGQQVCHHCDEPSCINPEHLFIGTPQDNTNDMIAKGRQGKRSPSLSKATAEKVIRLLTAGHFASDIAARLNITRSAVDDINYRLAWEDLLPQDWVPKVKPPQFRNAKVTPEQLPEIRRLVNGGYTLKSVGNRYGITESAVCRIMKGNRWQKS